MKPVALTPGTKITHKPTGKIMIVERVEIILFPEEEAPFVRVYMIGDPDPFMADTIASGFHLGFFAIE